MLDKKFRAYLLSFRAKAFQHLELDTIPERVVIAKEIEEELGERGGAARMAPPDRENELARKRMKGTESSD